jgi:hypothetical protein
MQVQLTVGQQFHFASRCPSLYHMPLDKMQRLEYLLTGKHRTGLTWKKTEQGYNCCFSQTCILTNLFYRSVGVVLLNQYPNNPLRTTRVQVVKTRGQSVSRPVNPGVRHMTKFVSRSRDTRQRICPFLNDRIRG